MSFEVFQTFDKEAIDNSINKSDYLKTYNHQGAKLNNFDQNTEFILKNVTTIIK